MNVNAELSTRFSDWIETNLLKLDSSQVRSISFDGTKADPETRSIIPGQKFTLEKGEGATPWKIDGVIPPGQELDTGKVTSLTSALSDLKIVGVRPKPKGLAQALRKAATNVVRPTTQVEQISLVRAGFHTGSDGKLYSNQGEVIVRTDGGAVYTLRFGEALFASDDALTAGVEDEAKAKEAESKKSEGSTENRYLMVTVAFDPTLVPEPPKPPVELTIPDDPFWKAPDDPKRIAEEKAAKEKVDKEKADREKQLATAETKVKAISDRFADWYYVTPGDSFRSIALERPALLKAISAEPPPGGGMPPGFPGMPKGAGLPQFHPR